MRRITISRRKMFTAGGLALHISIDGDKKKKMTLGNGKSVSFELDENTHVIRAEGGLFTNKNFCDEITIPAGPFSYNLLVELPYAGDMNHPRFRAAGENEFDKLDLGQFTGSSVTKFLLLPDVRAKIAQFPNLRLRLVLTQENWEIHALVSPETDVLMYKGEYLKVTGSGLGVISHNLQKTYLQDPLKLRVMERKIVESYIGGLPDYEVLEDLTFVAKY